MPPQLGMGIAELLEILCLVAVLIVVVVLSKSEANGIFNLTQSTLLTRKA